MHHRHARGRVAAVLSALALGSGCGQGPAAEPPGDGPVEGVTADGAAGPTGRRAVEIAARAVTGDGLPDVVGDSIGEARRALHRAGVRTQVIAFDATAAVTDQYPRGGQPPAADGVVTLWVGEPAALPAPAPPPVTPAPPPASPQPSSDVLGAADAVAAAVPPAREDESGSPPAAEPVLPTREEAPLLARTEAAAPQPAGALLAGAATWYGPGFAGRGTACGGRFDPEELTMASRELPCGTRARVTGPTGRSVEVTVTDWGPAEWTGKRFDLSVAAFAQIAGLRAGVVQVSVDVLA